ncbi:hypothetical protein HPB50_002884 [Hyalomma asiaticum]|uniref:Uncharacterized protein n=1 Tax=Hyalomma asiaticum TaxID=266040 RepID=A0ACB7SG46_HYAAI|nr:hypothetical protein HPB50_002884 [Hyalomma asiaticum]
MKSSGRGRDGRDPSRPPPQQRPDGGPPATPSCSQYELAWSSCVLRRKSPRGSNRWCSARSPVPLAGNPPATAVAGPQGRGRKRSSL